MNVINYLRNNSLEKLYEDFKIVIIHHDFLPIFILNYDQIDSPKFDPIVMDCRGLVLDNNYNIVARSFERFFNYGEFPERDKNFNWNNVSVKSKEDGSLILLYYYGGSWRVNTRGSFGDMFVSSFMYTWKDLVDKIVGDGYEELDKSLTYVCELCTPYNKVVRSYDSNRLYNLAVFDKKSEIVYDKRHSFFHYPDVYNFSSIDEVCSYLDNNALVDPTFEGFVLMDDGGMRIKVKSKSYYNLHRKKNNGSFSVDFIVESVLKNEVGEILVYFPEYREIFDPVFDLVDDSIGLIYDLWEKNKDIELQKDFALAVIGSKLSSYVFLIRKLKIDNVTREKVRQIMVEFPEVMIKLYRDFLTKKS